MTTEPTTDYDVWKSNESPLHRCPDCGAVAIETERGLECADHCGWVEDEGDDDDE